MRRSGRYCLYSTLRVVNVVVNIFGMIIIIYSLWLLKKWFDGVSDLPSPSNLPRPWYIDDDNKGFRSFLLFHIVVCRLIGIVVLVAQIKIVVLAAILWAVGGELILDSNIPAPIDIKQSFLADHNSPVFDAPGWREEILKHYMDGIFTKSFCQLRRNQS
ncbi:hypothetical protein RHSIM_Rhsim07G0153200 [Rhododendron simsii]|uniref:Uncharacterized protein n=1 Tax=Rhododendron simsii TaxID=118357 RepID=A0A834GNV2_RHOSS|nr:hypothetical protein RHSIM_Rhsim07G0153200 [Rhododendron simsii]